MAGKKIQKAQTNDPITKIIKKRFRKLERFYFVVFIDKSRTNLNEIMTAPPPNFMPVKLARRIKILII